MNRVEASVGRDGSSLQEAMFGVVHHRDTVSVCCRDHKRFRPVCMCLKQFVSLRGNQTPSFSTNLDPSEVRPRFSIDRHLSSYLMFILKMNIHCSNR